MQSLERAYSIVKSGLTVINESGDLSKGSVSVPDATIKQAGIIPNEYAKFFIPGSGLRRGNNEQWTAEYKLKIPTNKVTDGTEDRETAYDYIEKQIKGMMPNDAGRPGGEYVRSFALVDGDASDDQFTTIRCVASGGLDI